MVRVSISALGEGWSSLDIRMGKNTRGMRNELHLPA